MLYLFLTFPWAIETDDFGSCNLGLGSTSLPEIARTLASLRLLVRIASTPVVFSRDLATGGLSNFGRVVEVAFTSDTPGMSQNMTFDEVGGLDDRTWPSYPQCSTDHLCHLADISALTEMIKLPILYAEVLQRFNSSQPAKTCFIVSVRCSWPW